MYRTSELRVIAYQRVSSSSSHESGPRNMEEAVSELKSISSLPSIKNSQNNRSRSGSTSELLDLDDITVPNLQASALWLLVAWLLWALIIQVASGLQI